MPEQKQINFTVVPGEPGGAPRVYSNFCAVAHTPFDLTLTFCEVLPLSERDLREAENEHTIHAPVRVSVVVPHSIVANLVGVLQEHIRALAEQNQNQAWGKGPVH